MAVARGVRDGDHALGGEEGVQDPRLRGADDLHVEANRLGEAVDALNPREFTLVVGQTQTTGGVPAHVLTGPGLERGVKLVAVGVDLGEVIAARDARALPGGVPGGARGELVLLDQDGVGATFQREVIQEARPHDSTADDHDLRIRFHGSEPSSNKAGTIAWSPRAGQLNSSSRLVEIDPASDSRHAAPPQLLKVFDQRSLARISRARKQRKSSIWRQFRHFGVP